ncbi:MAG TPA: acetyl-CoA C-acetyltransferase [Cryomorphaceae bacterium]|nr:acetyl-CoA C-acetyltransferase [Cryomorphaceae bacterium]|tara:strand:- start:82 stop:1260 length:1179 start_codon:yes stop_codon:yes gene_type:complete
MKEVVIVSAVRTPIGSFGGALSGISAPKLGATAISAAIEGAGIQPKDVEEVLMGNVLQAGIGQAPARQAAIYAGIPDYVPCTTINKVCSSGMKAIMMAAQSIKSSDADIIVAGGMENMSAVPHYHMSSRNGVKLGNTVLVDGLVNDGLTDVYNNQHMGLCAELCAAEYGFSREDQDAFALESYHRSAAAWEAGKFDKEVISVVVPQHRGDDVVVDTDEDFSKVRYDKVPILRPVFKKNGTITAANASNINDGACAMVIMSADKAIKMGLKPIAKITGYADAAHEPEWFTTAPAKALPKAIARAGISQDAVDYFELNEAFSIVGLANMKILGLDASKVNLNGGAVSLGHPLGASGARIVNTLLSVLEQNDGKIGAAAICNGGGGASAIVVERL